MDACAIIQAESEDASLLVHRYGLGSGLQSRKLQEKFGYISSTTKHIGITSANIHHGNTTRQEWEQQ